MDEKRLVDANALISELKQSSKWHPERFSGLMSAITHIKEQPTVDAVEVVRCKDCKRYRKSERAQTLEIGWCNKWHNIMEYFDFCSFGEREDNE